MTKYFLGVDIGGTKSHALITDQTGQAVGFAATGPGNYESIGWDAYRANLKNLTQKALQSANLQAAQITGAGFGIGGYDWPYEREPHIAGIEALGLACPIKLVNDTIIGLAAGASQGWGVVLIAGTGNNCRGRDATGREGRTAGNGSWFGEFGGAGEMVWRAIHKVVAAWSKRIPPTTLTEIFIKHAGAKDILDLLEGLQMGRLFVEADAAPLVFKAAEEGDEAARAVIEWSAQEAASLAIGVIRQLNLEQQPFEIVQVGGMYKGGPIFTEPLENAIRELAPQAKFVHLAAPPVVGAVLLAMEVDPIDGYAVRETVIATTETIMSAKGN